MKVKIWYMIAALGLICMFAGPASALSITTRNASGMDVSGLTNNTIMNGENMMVNDSGMDASGLTNNTIMNGENITVNVSGMTNGTFFQLNVTNHQEIPPSMNALAILGAFNTNITIPFKISKAAFNLSETNTSENSVIIGENEIQPGEIQREGQSHEMIFNGSSVMGSFSRNGTLDEIVEGTLITKWAATPVPGAKIVTSTFELNGTKISGPENFDLNTSFTSANPSTINIEIMANGTPAYQNTFFIKNEILPGSSSASGSDPLTGWLISFWQWVSGK